MVRIMLAGRSTQYPRHHHRGGASSPFWASPTGSQGQSRAAGEQRLVSEDFGGARQTSFGEIGTSGSCWNNVLAAEGGVDTIPRDSSTCILWCAVALGALVRGHPLARVGAFARAISPASFTPTNHTSKHRANYLRGLHPPTAVYLHFFLSSLRVRLAPKRFSVFGATEQDSTQPCGSSLSHSYWRLRLRCLFES